MSKALEYFKKVYKDIPEWVQIMHDYNPKMLEYYTDIRSEAFKSAAISDKEKDELIAAFNAGRFYDRSMVYHTQAAFNKGSRLEDLVEYFMISYIYKGKKALVHSLKAIAQYREDKDGVILKPASEYASLEEVLIELKDWTKAPIIDRILENIEDIDKIIMSAGAVSESRKYLALVGMYITELDGVGAGPHVDNARKHGVTEEELADLGYIIILTAGIPSWFELSDHLKIK